MGCHSLFHRIFLTQGSNLCLLHCRQILYHWATGEAQVGYFFFFNWRIIPLQNFAVFCQTSTWLSHRWTPVLYSQSVQFSRSVVSDSLPPHESKHARPPCPSPSPGVHSDSCPSSQWCHPAISSSVVPFSSAPDLSQHQSCPMSQLFAWGGQRTGVSASASFLPKKSQDWSLEWTGWISLQSKGLSRVFSNTTVQKHQFFSP